MSECCICLDTKDKVIKCDTCVNVVCDICYLKQVKITKSNKDLLFSTKCPACRTDASKSVDDVDKNIVCAVLKKTYKVSNEVDEEENKDLRHQLGQNERHITTLNKELQDLRAEISVLKNTKDAEIEQIKNLLTKSADNELNNLKRIIKRYDDDEKIYVKCADIDNIRLKNLGGSYDADLKRWWIYIDNINKDKVLKSFKQYKKINA